MLFVYESMETLTQRKHECNVHTGRHQTFGTFTFTENECPLCQIDAIENGEALPKKKVRSLNIL